MKASELKQNADKANEKIFQERAKAIEGYRQKAREQALLKRKEDQKTLDNLLLAMQDHAKKGQYKLVYHGELSTFIFDELTKLGYSWESYQFPHRAVIRWETPNECR